MKQTLALKLGQQLTMTPQLQQAIRLLQLSALDLQQEIQTTLESNPLLELDDDDSAGELESGDAENLNSESDNPQESDDDSDYNEAGDEKIESTIPDELPVDTSWDDIYEPPLSSPGPSSDEDWDFASNDSQSESLYDHLAWQLNLAPMSDTDRAIAFTLIDAIDADGMLSSSIEEITLNCNQGEDPDFPIEADEVVAVLKLIQQFDPPGIGARNLAECLELQLRQFPPELPWRSEALNLVSEHLALLAARDFLTLQRRCKLNEGELAKVIALIQSLNPRPGSVIDNQEAEYVIPDVIVSKDNNRWKVELNPDSIPKVRINSQYASMIQKTSSSADSTYLKDNLQEARWFLKSIQSRNDTLLKVATNIVERQRGFLEYGEEAMKPLVLHHIAEAVEMHESTISRVTSRKYMHTPRGIYELKYFFSSHVGTTTGGEVSSTAIRALIKKLTAEENPRKPLSDSKIAAILAEQKITVARRTVAKYRESLSIPPSNERKRLV